MKTKFNFNSQICTTREQSDRLLALGLRKETADMTIHIKNDDGWYVTAEPFCEWEDDMNTIPSLEETEPIIPAWSPGRLLEIMRMKASSQVVPLDNTFDRLIDGIEKRIKDGYFNKEYLRELPKSQGTMSTASVWMKKNGIF